MERLIGDSKVIVCAGSGGVGKTTISACLGILAAQEGRRVLVLTIDPARRLATALGIEGQKEVEVEVPEQNYPGVLSASMIDPAEVFNDFIRRSAPSEEMAQRLLDNRLYRQLATTLNGSQEFTSLERLLRATEKDKYDLVILDTPPAQHAIDFLRAPEKIFALFQESITRWFIQDKKSVGLLQKVFNQGTKTVLAALEKVTGSQFISELSDFFQNMSGLQETVSQRSIEVHRLLTSPQTSFVLVTGFDEAKLKEAHAFYSELRRGGYHLSGVIVNRSFPEWLGEGISKDVPPEWHKNESYFKLIQFYAELQDFYSSRQKVYDEFQRHLGEEIPVARVPEMRDNVYGLDGLELLAQRLKEKLSTEV